MFTLSNFEFSVENIIKLHDAFLPPSRWSELLILDNLLDNSLDGRRLERGLCYTGRTGCGNRSNGSGSNHAPTRISALGRATLALRTAILLSRAMRAWDRLGVSTLQAPWFMGFPGVVLWDKPWLRRESMTARTARIRDSMRRGWLRKWFYHDSGGWSVQSGVSVPLCHAHDGKKAEPS
jgi:hypothetical protein